MTGNERTPASLPGPTDPAALVRLWESRDPGVWESNSSRYADAGSTAIQFGQQALAYDILSEGKSLFPEESKIGFLAALSAANLGSMSLASAILDGVVPKLSKTDPLFSEALSLRGRIETRRRQSSGSRIEGPTCGADGRTALSVTPLEFLERLALLIHLTTHPSPPLSRGAGSQCQAQISGHRART